MSFLSLYVGNMEFGNYNNYEIWPFQVLGVGCALLVFAIVFAGMAYSKLFNAFMKTPESEEKEPEWVNLELPDKQEVAADYNNMDTMEEPVVVPASDDNANTNFPDDEDAAVLT